RRPGPGGCPSGPGKAPLPLGEYPMQDGFEHHPSHRMEMQCCVIARCLILAEVDLAEAAAQRLPVEIACSFWFPLPPLGPLAHADTTESIAYLAVAGVLEHSVPYGRLQRRRIGVQPCALANQF